MATSFQTAFFQTIYTHSNQSDFFDTFRTWPVVSTASSLAETTLNTALAIATIPAVLTLQAARIVPLPGGTHKIVTALASDSLNLLRIFISNIALALTSAIPFAGNYVAHQLFKQKQTIERLQAFSSTTIEAHQDDEKDLEQIQESASLLKEVGEENDALRRQSEEQAFHISELEKTVASLKEQISSLQVKS